MWEKKTLHRRKEDKSNTKEEYKRWTLKELTEIAAKEMTDLSLIECHHLFCISIPGMTFIDMAHLEKSAMDSNRLCYYHLKAREWIEVTLTEEMIDIISFLSPLTRSSPYLFPILLDAGQIPINKCLKKSRQLSAHIARHIVWKASTERQQIPPPDPLDGSIETD